MVYFVKSLLILIAVSLVATSYAYKLAAMDFEPVTNNDEDLILNKEYISYLRSVIDAYRGEQNNILTENNPTFETKYRKWKRNADLINSLLALPRGMGEAGR